jgi:hypothetical protein
MQFKNINTPWLLVLKPAIPTEDRRLLAKLVSNLRVEDVASSPQGVPTAVNLGFLDHSSYFPFK